MPTASPDIYSDRDAAPDIEPDHVDDVKEDEARDSSDNDKDDGDDKDKPSDSATGLVSKTFFGDKELKPGTTCKVRVEKVYDDQVSISYVPHDTKSDDSDDDDDKEKKSEDVYD